VGIPAIIGIAAGAKTFERPTRRRPAAGGRAVPPVEKTSSRPERVLFVFSIGGTDHPRAARAGRTRVDPRNPRRSASCSRERRRPALGVRHLGRRSSRISPGLSARYPPRSTRNAAGGKTFERPTRRGPAAGGRAVPPVEKTSSRPERVLFVFSIGGTDHPRAARAGRTLVGSA